MTDRELAIAFHNKRLVELKLAEAKLDIGYRTLRRHCTAERLERVRYELVIVRATLRALSAATDKITTELVLSEYGQRLVQNELWRTKEEA